MIRLSPFAGMAPRVSGKLLSNEQAQLAKNCKLKSGELRAIRGTAHEWTPVKVGLKQSIHLFARQFWFHWLDDVDVVRGAIPTDTTERTYYTGDGVPKVTNAEIATSGSNYPAAAYTLGIPAPSQPPQVSVVNTLRSGTVTGVTQVEITDSGTRILRITSPSHGMSSSDIMFFRHSGFSGDLAAMNGRQVSTLRVPTLPSVGLLDIVNSMTIDIVDADNYDVTVRGLPEDADISYAGGATWQEVDPEDPADRNDRFWVYTYVSAWGEEGPPSPPSRIMSVGYNAKVSLTDLQPPPSGAYNIASKRIYRSSSGSGSASLMFEGEVPVATSSFQSAKLDGELQEPLTTMTFDPPPATMKGLVGMANGMMAGFDGKDVYFCEPYQPHAWPRDYMQTVDYNIIGMASFGTSLVIGTEGYPYLATGSDPLSMSVTKIEIEQACVSKRSVVSLGESGVAYASPDGLVVVGPGGARVITEGIMTRDEWQSYKPDSLIAFSHDGQYIGFYNTGAKTGGFIIDPRGSGLVEVDIYAHGGYVDLLTDSLYLLVDNQVVRWDAGSPIPYTWISKRYTTPPISFPSAMLVADSYANSQVKFFADGNLIHTETVQSARPFRLPAGFRATEWEFEIAGTDNVHELRVGSMSDMA